MLNKMERKSAIIFLIVLCMTMLVGFAFLKVYAAHGADDNVMALIAAAQMLYPMFAVILTLMLMRRQYHVDRPIPKKIFSVFIVYTLFVNVLMIYGLFNMSHFVTIFPYGLFILSILFLVVMYFEDTDIRTKYGMAFIPVKTFLSYSMFFILFIASVTAIQSLLLIHFGFYHNDNLWGTVLKGFMLSFNIVFFLLEILLFIGEEFAWRGFLQPLLQKRFGVVKGLILLGVIWSFWHIPISMTAYSPENYILNMINQTAFCVFAACLLGYVYMKTKSLILSSFLHFINNMFASAFGTYINQTFQVKEVLISATLYIVCALIVIKIFLPGIGNDLEGFIE